MSYRQIFIDDYSDAEDKVETDILDKIKSFLVKDHGFDIEDLESAHHPTSIVISGFDLSKYSFGLDEREIGTIRRASDEQKISCGMYVMANGNECQVGVVITACTSLLSNKLQIMKLIHEFNAGNRAINARPDFQNDQITLSVVVPSWIDVRVISDTAFTGIKCSLCLLLVLLDYQSALKPLILQKLGLSNERFFVGIESPIDENLILKLCGYFLAQGFECGPSKDRRAIFIFTDIELLGGKKKVRQEVVVSFSGYPNLVSIFVPTFKYTDEQEVEMMSVFGLAPFVNYRRNQFIEFFSGVVGAISYTHLREEELTNGKLLREIESVLGFFEFTTDTFGD